MIHHRRFHILIFYVLIATKISASAATIISVSASTTCTVSNRIVIVRANHADVTITLPPATIAGEEISIIIDDATHNVSVQAAAGDQLIDPNSAAFMAGSACGNGESLDLISTGTGVWHVKSSNNYFCANWSAHAAASAQTPVPRGVAAGQVATWNGSNWNAAYPDSVICLYGGATNSIAAARTEWVMLNGEGQTATTQTLDDVTVIPRHIALRNLFVQVTPAPGANESVSFKIKKVSAGGVLPGVAQTIFFTIAGTAVTASDTTNVVDCLPGDILYLEIIGSTNCAARTAAWGMQAVRR